MRVAHLSLADFRNYRTAELTLAPGRNLIIGRNGQGKTNLVEAIGYFASLRSHRVSQDSAMIRSGQESAVMRMRIEALGREAVLEMQLNRDRVNRAQVNRNAVRPRELMRWFSSVMFAPEDLGIVRGEPSIRRRFIDEAVSARAPVLSGVLADYERVVRQRTALLKSARRTSSETALRATLEVWNEQLVALGSRIIEARRNLVRELHAPLASSYALLAEQDHRPSLRLSESVGAALRDGGVSRETPGTTAPPDVPRETLAEEFHEALRVMQGREVERGLTLVGPHRDDLVLGLNDLPVKGYASHGESWSFALALKLGLAELIRADSPSGDPVIVLDDVFAELDRMRRERLLASVGEFEQIIVTAAVEEDIPEEGDWHRVRVHAGEIVGPSASQVAGGGA